MQKEQKRAEEKLKEAEKLDEQSRELKARVLALEDREKSHKPSIPKLLSLLCFREHRPDVLKPLVTLRLKGFHAQFRVACENT